VSFELFVGIYRKVRRRKIFALAQKRAKETGLPLLVVGDPDNGIMSIATGQDYGCADVCVDLTGCPTCPNGIKGKLEDVLPTLDLSRYVVFISCVLEYVDDLPKIVSYLEKMDPKNLFIVNVEWYTLTAYFYPYFLTRERPPNYVIYECPPYSSKISYKKIH
jgi:hypothetical protein